MPSTEGRARFGEHETWYRVEGDLGAGTPLVVLHGGPGCTHDYVEAFADIAETGRAVVLYDQVGNGRSTRLRDKGADYWTVELFLSELDGLLAHLGIAGDYALLGQSWGGMLAAEHAVRAPKGLKALVIADSPASMVTWVQEANRLRDLLPPEVQATLLAHEAAGTTDDPAYAEAVKVFNARHVCRLDPAPSGVQRTFDALLEDSTVYGSMNGPSEFHVIGSLKAWTIEDRLHAVAVPTLLISGRHDEATELCVQPYADNIPDVRWRIFEESSHMPHVEEREATMAEVSAFLDAAAPLHARTPEGVPA